MQFHFCGWALVVWMWAQFYNHTDAFRPRPRLHVPPPVQFLFCGWLLLVRPHVNVVELAAEGASQAMEVGCWVGVEGADCDWVSSRQP